jgi:hypothetical protein
MGAADMEIIENQIMFERFLEERPALHRLKNGMPTQWGLHGAMLRFAWDHTAPGDKSIETGGGLSTVTFAMRNTRHTAIFPAYHTPLRDNINDYLQRESISPASLHYVLAESQRVLPSWTDSGYDMVLLDGDHAFPVPCIDWFYLASKIKVNGLLMLDDTQLWPVRILRDFLRAESNWRLVWELSGSSVFKLVAPWKEKWWGEQIFTVAHSDLHPNAKTMVPDAVKQALPSMFSAELQ